MITRVGKICWTTIHDDSQANWEIESADPILSFIPACLITHTDQPIRLFQVDWRGSVHVPLRLQADGLDQLVIYTRGPGT